VTVFSKNFVENVVFSEAFYKDWLVELSNVV